MVSMYRVLDKTKSLMDQKTGVFQQLWHQIFGDSFVLPKQIEYYWLEEKLSIMLLETTALTNGLVLACKNG